MCGAFKRDGTDVLVQILSYSNVESKVGAVVECSIAALRVAGTIPARTKYLYDHHLVVLGLAVSVFVNASTIHELLLVKMRLRAVGKIAPKAWGGLTRARLVLGLDLFKINQV